MKGKFFELLFDNQYEYPREQISKSGGIAQNTLYSYISNSFLNGFINYVVPIKSYLVKRYSSDELADEYGTVWEDCVYNANTSSNMNTDLNSLGDDVIVLACTEDDYWFFWFDCDVSDCMIGRTNRNGVTVKEVTQLFETFLNETFDDKYEIKLKGWISF